MSIKNNPKVLILTGYGINCEEESAYAFKKYGGETPIIHINDLIESPKKLDEFQILMFPGGFSYGDHTGAGKALANKIKNNLNDEIKKFTQRDTLTLGICNGFQVLANLGIFNEKFDPEVALMRNEKARYICRWIHIKNTSSKCIFMKGIETLFVPIAHGEGKFFAENKVIKNLEENDQIAVKYCDPDGNLADQKYPINPNGALLDIAGICDNSGRIFGMMPHPERNLFFSNRPDFAFLKEELLRNGKEFPEEGEGGKIFQNAVDYFG